MIPGRRNNGAYAHPCSVSKTSSPRGNEIDPFVGDGVTEGWAEYCAVLRAMRFEVQKSTVLRGVRVGRIVILRTMRFFRRAKVGEFAFISKGFLLVSGRYDCCAVVVYF
jgi:hypothetical protein